MAHVVVALPRSRGEPAAPRPAPGGEDLVAACVRLVQALLDEGLVERGVVLATVPAAEPGR